MKLSSFLPALALAFAAPILCQSSDGSYWNEYPKPANVTQIRGLGSLVLLETPTEYHFFSGQHRKWTVHPVVAPTLVGVANKQCVWRDGTTVYGYSTFSGKVEALPTSGAAIVSIGSATSSWTAYVQDGNDVFAFSAFFGEWKQLSLSQPPLVGIGSHVVSAFDNGRVHAFSAFFGEWVTLPTQGVGAVYPWRNGVMATFSAPDAVSAFSAYTNTWNTIAWPTSGLTFDARVSNAWIRYVIQVNERVNEANPARLLQPNPTRGTVRCRNGVSARVEPWGATQVVVTDGTVLQLTRKKMGPFYQCDVNGQQLWVCGLFLDLN